MSNVYEKLFSLQTTLLEMQQTIAKQQERISKLETSLNEMVTVLQSIQQELNDDISMDIRPRTENIVRYV